MSLDAGPAEPAPPRAAGDGRRGISGWAIIAAFFAVMTGVFWTYQFASLATARDLVSQIADAVRNLNLGPILGPILKAVFAAPATFAADATLAIPVLRAAADYVAGGAFSFVLAAVSAGFGVAASFGFAKLAKAAFPTQAQTKPGEREIVFPRERGGGARVGGAAILLAMSWLVALVAVTPRVFDWWFVSYTDWWFNSLGFVSGGLSAGALFVFIDARAWWRKDQRQIEAAPETSERPSPEIDAFRNGLASALGESTLADIEVKPPQSSLADTEPFDLGPASEAHAIKLAIGVGEAALVAWRRAVRLFKRKDCNLAILEPLSRSHFAFLVEAISIVQDEGRCALVIAPDASGEHLFGNLKEAFSIHCSDITQNIWADVDRDKSVGISRSVLPSVIVVTDETFEERILRKDAKDFVKAVERIGLILLFDAHLLDLSQLRLHVAMLLQRTAPRDIRVVAHSARRRGVEAALQQVFEPTKRKFETLGFAEAASAPFRALAFRNDTDARDALIDKFYPSFDPPTRGRVSVGREYAQRPLRHEIEPLPLVARIGLRGDHAIRVNDLMLADPGRDDVERRWEAAGERLVKADPGSDNLARNLEDVFALRRTQPDSDNPAPLILVQDRANLVDVLTHLGLAAGGVPRLAIIAAEAYPLRDFILDDIRHGGRFTVEAEPFLLPLAPQPEEGLRELARLVFSKMVAGDAGQSTPGDRARSGISRSDAIELFSKLSERRLLAAHRLSPTRLGIKQLLEGQFGGTFEIAAEPTGVSATPAPRLGARTPIDDDVVFVCLNAEERAGDVSDYVPLTKAGLTAEVSQHDGVIARDDHGLAYVKGSTIVARDGVYEIEDVEDARVKGKLTDDPNSRRQGLASAERPIFSRRYGIDLDAETAIVTPPRQGAISKGDVVLSHFRLFAPVRRLTYGRISEESLADRSLRQPRRPMSLAVPDQAAKSLRSGLAQVIRFERTKDDHGAGDEHESRLAFTLQATLADVMLSLFPGLHHRTAVVSPQAGPAFNRLDAASQSALAAHVAGRYPRLSAMENSGRLGPRALDPEAFTARLNRLAADAWAGGDGAANAADGSKSIDLLIVEDWPGDLGVCGAIENNLGHIQKLWLGYLAWLAANADRPDFFHRFGGETPCEEFVYADALQILAAVT